MLLYQGHTYLDVSLYAPGYIGSLHTKALGGVYLGMVGIIDSTSNV